MCRRHWQNIVDMPKLACQESYYNTVLVEMIRRSSEAKLSILFVKSGSCSEHYYDFASVNP